MTAADVRDAVARFFGSRIVLWGAFALAHLWLGLLALYAPGLPLGDVTLVYRFWMEHALDTGVWVGIHTVWVYPILALVPMVAALAAGPELYASSWLTLVMALDAAAFAVLLHRVRRSVAVAWWWLAFLVLLGPIAVARIDAITVAVAIPGVLLLARMPVVASTLLTVAAWIKVWPAALVAAAFVVLRDRLAVAAAALTTTGAVILGALLLGAGANVFSFVGQQTGRGLQIEAVLATPWMWDAVAGGSRIYYDQSILTFQIVGPGTASAVDAATPLLVASAVGLLALAVAGTRRGVAATDLLPSLALALTVALIVTNKVGSPQFAAWLAVPILLGLVLRARSFLVPAVLGLAVAGLTQAVYPYLYSSLLAADAGMVAVLTIRNALYLVLLGWAVVALVRLVRRGARVEDGRSETVLEGSIR